MDLREGVTLVNILAPGERDAVQLAVDPHLHGDRVQRLHRPDSRNPDRDISRLGQPPVTGTAGATAEAAGAKLSRPTPIQRPAAPAMTNAAIKIREVQRNARLLSVALPLPPQ